MPICSSVSWTWRGASGAGGGGRRRSLRLARGRAPRRRALMTRPCGPVPLHASEVDPGLRGQPAGQRRGEDAIAGGRGRAVGLGRGLRLRGRAPSRPSPRSAGPARGWPAGVEARRSALGRGGRRSRRGLARRALRRLQARDRRVDLHPLRAFRHQDLLDHALIDGLHLHGRLVGLDLGDHVAGLDLVAGLHVPLGERAFLHGRRQRGHEDVGHQFSRLKWASAPAFASQFRPSKASTRMSRPSGSSRQRAFTDQPSGLERGR